MSVITCNNRPVTVGGSVVEKLLQFMRDDNLIDIASLAIFSKGDQVFIQNGTIKN